MCVHRRRKTRIVRVVDELTKNRLVPFPPAVSSPTNRKPPSLANIGKLVETVMVDLALVHKVRSLVLVRMFVLASLRSKSFGASVTGSWSKRGASAWAVSMSPWELTNVAKKVKKSLTKRAFKGHRILSGYAVL